MSSFFLILGVVFILFTLLFGLIFVYIPSSQTRKPKEYVRGGAIAPQL